MKKNLDIDEWYSEDGFEEDNIPLEEKYVVTLGCEEVVLNNTSRFGQVE